MWNLVSRCTLSSAKRPFSSCYANLSGHNKWSKIKQKKGAMDAQKGAIFGKANRDIMLAVRNGGSADPNNNLQLAAVLRRAKEQDVPKENIEKALAKASQRSDKGGDGFTYEALAYNSVGLIIECSTDNANRTIHSLREILNTHSARNAPVKFMFQRKGYVKLALEKGEREGHRLEQLLDAALAAGADDFDSAPSDDVIAFTCQPSALAKLTAVLAGDYDDRGRLVMSELVYAPLETSESSDEIEHNLKTLVGDLEANEDVLRVWTSLQSY